MAVWWCSRWVNRKAETAGNGRARLGREGPEGGPQQGVRSVVLEVARKSRLNGGVAVVLLPRCQHIPPDHM